MKIIDAHTHPSFEVQRYVNWTRQNGIDYSAMGLKRSAAKIGIATAIGITPHIGVPVRKVLKEIQNSASTEVRWVLNVNPRVLSRELPLIDAALRQEQLVGLKVHPGYYPISPLARAYRAVYKLAAKYQRPVVIHTGDVYQKSALLKWA